MWETIITGLDNDKQQLAKVLDTGNLVVFRDNYSDFFFKICYMGRIWRIHIFQEWRWLEQEDLRRAGIGQYTSKFENNESNPQLFIYNAL